MTTPEPAADGPGPSPGRGGGAPGRRRLAVVLAIVLSLAALVVVVAPRLSARLTGDELRVAVAPVDPIDPFRGAYVRLTYPSLRFDDEQPRGDVFVTLVRDGAVYRGSQVVRQRPAAGPYLACRSSGYDLKCGIESLFVGQARARVLEDLVAGGSAVAVLKVDGRGNAAVTGVEAG